MRKRASTRRLKARLLLGRWISRFDVLNNRLDRMIARRGLNIEVNALTDHYRRAPWPAKTTTT
jgi:hypothetical protein